MLQTGVKKTQVLNRAFTLLELILVVLILAALVGLSTPMFRNTFGSVQLSSAYSDLTNVLNYARQSAIFDRAEYRAILKSDESKFWVEHKVLEESGPVFKRPQGKMARIYSLPSGINIDSDKDYLVFYPDGKADAATITIGNGSKAYTLTTEGTRGYVKTKR